MTKDEFQKAVDDAITDCIRNDYSFGSYAHKVTEAVWPLLEAAEKERDDVAHQLVQSEIGKRAISEERDAAELMSLALRAKVEAMERQEPVGTAHAMPGAGAFTMACFDVQDIPVGTMLYTLPGAKGE